MPVSDGSRAAAGGGQGGGGSPLLPCMQAGRCRPSLAGPTAGPTHSIDSDSGVKESQHESVRPLTCHGALYYQAMGGCF